MTLGDRTRRFFEPSRPWNIMFLIAIGVIVGYGWMINSRTIRDEAIRASEAQSAKTAAVARCVESRPLLRKFSRHVRGVNEFTLTIVGNSEAVLEQTPRSDPQHDVRSANLRRLINARNKIAALPGFPVPTLSECRDRGNN